MLNDPGVVKLLREHFVAVAVDNANNINLTPSERQWLADKGGRACTQGMSVFTAGGKLLASGGGFDPEPNRRMLRQALDRFRPDEEPAAVEPLNAHDRDAVPASPPGGLVLYVTWKVLGGSDNQAKPGTEAHAFRKALGVDRLWVRQDEARALARGHFPPSLKDRMVRYHVSTVLKAKDIDLVLQDGRLTGSFRPEGGGEPGSALGFVEARGGRVTRLDLLFKGPAGRVKNFGFLAGLEAIPEGEKVPVGLFFSLADPAEDLSRLPPHRSWRALDAYLR